MKFTFTDNEEHTRPWDILAENVWKCERINSTEWNKNNNFSCFLLFLKKKLGDLMWKCKLAITHKHQHEKNDQMSNEQKIK